MRPLVIVPTYNERDNLSRSARAAAGDSRLARAHRRRRVAGRHGTDRRRDMPRPIARACRCCTERASAALACRTSTACTWRCEPMPRTSARWTRTSRTIRPTCPRLLAAAEHADFVIGSRYVAGRTHRELAAASPDAQRIREPLHPRHHAAARSATAPAASAAGGARRSSGFRWPRSAPTAMRSSSSSPGRRRGRGCRVRRGADHVRRAARGRLEALGQA